MTTNQIMELDCREEKNCRIIQKVLKQIKPLSKEVGIIPLGKIEKLITVLSKRYNVHVRDFVPDVWSNSNESIWRATIIDDNDLRIIKLVYGLSVYEVFAKAAIYMYSVREGVGRRQE